MISYYDEALLQHSNKIHIRTDPETDKCLDLRNRLVNLVPFTYYSTAKSYRDSTSIQCLSHTKDWRSPGSMK